MRVDTGTPRHIAIIMDGNGRWAREKKLPRTMGHREGIKRVKEIVRAAGELGLKVLTLFAFSTENWTRPKNEVNVLLRSLVVFLGRELNALIKDNVRFLWIGRRDSVPGYVLKSIEEAEEKTRHNSGLTVVLAFNYGARQEIVDALKKIGKDLLEHSLSLDSVDEDLFSSYLYTKGLPDPDLLIRTSGEMRLSNFLLWQASYAELYFPKKYWPDFKKEDLVKAIRFYKRRERRFGGIGAGEKNN